MTTKFNFSPWGEPTNMVSICGFDEIRSFTKIVLCSYSLHQFVTDPFSQRNYRSGVTMEDSICECVNMIHCHKKISNDKIRIYNSKILYQIIGMRVYQSCFHLCDVGI